MRIARFPLCSDNEAERVIKEAYHAMEHKEWFAIDPDAFIEQGDGYLYKAYIDGKAAGILTVAYPGILHKELSLSSPTADMDIVAVLPEYRGRGIMSALMERAERDAITAGIKVLLATVHPDNIPSRHTMEKLGYKEVLHKTMYGGFDRLIMMKRIAISSVQCCRENQCL